MNGFMASPFSVPVLIVAIAVGIPVISSTILKLSRERSRDSRAFEQTESELRAEVESLKKRVENLETIVLELEKHI